MGVGERANPFATWKKTDGVSSLSAYDRSGREINAGDAVYVIGKQDIIWRVIHVKPLLGKDAPPGAVEIAMQAILLSGVQGGAPLGDIIKVRDVSEFASVLEADKS